MPTDPNQGLAQQAMAGRQANMQNVGAPIQNIGLAGQQQAMRIGAMGNRAMPDNRGAVAGAAAWGAGIEGAADEFARAKERRDDMQHDVNMEGVRWKYQKKYLAEQTKQFNAQQTHLDELGRKRSAWDQSREVKMEQFFAGINQIASNPIPYGDETKAAAALELRGELETGLRAIGESLGYEEVDFATDEAITMAQTLSMFEGVKRRSEEDADRTQADISSKIESFNKQQELRGQVYGAIEGHARASHGINADMIKQRILQAYEAYGATGEDPERRRQIVSETVGDIFNLIRTDKDPSHVSMLLGQLTDHRATTGQAVGPQMIQEFAMGDPNAMSGHFDSAWNAYFNVMYEVLDELEPYLALALAQQRGLPVGSKDKMQEYIEGGGTEKEKQARLKELSVLPQEVKVVADDLFYRLIAETGALDAVGKLAPIYNMEVGKGLALAMERVARAKGSVTLFEGLQEYVEMKGDTLTEWEAQRVEDIWEAAERKQQGGLGAQPMPLDVEPALMSQPAP